MKRSKQTDVHMMAFLGAVNGSIEPIPPGFKTTRELSVLWKRSTAQTSKMLTKALDCGTIEIKSFRIKTSAGIRGVPHYRPTPKQSP
jgi:hypothetical protein